MTAKFYSRPLAHARIHAHTYTLEHNNNNNNNIYLLQLGCHPVEVVILHVYKT